MLLLERERVVNWNEKLVLFLGIMNLICWLNSLFEKFSVVDRYICRYGI